MSEKAKLYNSRRNFLKLVGGVSALGLAAYELSPLIKLYNARPMPESFNGYEKLPKKKIEEIVNSHIDSKLWNHLKQGDKDLIEEWREKANPLFLSYADFVQYFGELYFENDEQTRERHGDNYEHFISDEFVPDMMRPCEDGKISVATVIGMAYWAKHIVHGDYSQDIKDERKRVVFQHGREREMAYFGSNILTNKVLMKAYDKQPIYNVPRLGPHAGIRTAETDPSIALNDQDVSILSKALGIVWKNMPDKYMNVANTALHINNKMNLIESQRSAIGKRITDFCMNLPEDSEILKVFEAARNTINNGGNVADKFWIDIGLAPDINGENNEIAIQMTHQTHAWLEWVNSGGQEEQVTDAFINTRKWFSNPNKHINASFKMLIYDQMFNPKFQEYIEKYFSGNKDWNEIKKMWKEYEKIIKSKQNLIEQAYIEMSEFEYDPIFQSYVNEGLLKYYYLSCTNGRLPKVKEAVENNSLTQMSIIASIREISPSWIWVFDQDGPIAQNSITPFNIKGVLEQWEWILQISPENLDKSKAIAAILTGDFQDIKKWFSSNDNTTGKNYDDWLDRINPYRYILYSSPFSGTNLANILYSAALQ